jgi:signal transduction histidine kinase
MNGGSPEAETPAAPRLDQALEYTRPPGDRAAQMSLLFRLTAVLHGLTDLGAITSVLLSTLISEEGMGFDRAVLFLLDRPRRRLRGCGAAGERERELTRDLWKLLDGFPESLGDAVRLTLDPRHRMRSPLEKKARKLAYSLDDRTCSPVLCALGALPVSFALHGLPDPEDLVRAVGEGPWCYYPVIGARGVTGVLGVMGGYAQPFPEAVGEALALFSRHAGLSIERGQTYQSLERQLAEMATVQEVSRGILSATNLEDLLALISRVSARVMQASWAVTWVAEGTEEPLRAASHCGEAPQQAAFVERLLPLATRCAERRRPICLADAAAEGILDPAAGGEPRSVLFVPLLAYDRILGILGVGDREPQGNAEEYVFREDDEQFLAVLGAQVAIAIKNAQLFEQVRETEKRLRETQGLLMQTEKLAALGEMSAKVAHEIRNPLAAVGGFARRIQRSLAAADPNAEYAALIVREIARLEGILTEQLEFARLSKPRLASIDLIDVVQETLQLVRDEADRKGVEVKTEFGRNLPKVLLDRDKVKQVLLNILDNALGAVAKGNRIQVRADRVGGEVKVEVANDGEPLPGEILESLFVPFATTKAGGSGLGLAVAHQIVKEHGGEIHVRTGTPWSVVFTVSFPVRENQDRRRNLVERRKGRDRRRHAA